MLDQKSSSSIQDLIRVFLFQYVLYFFPQGYNYLFIRIYFHTTQPLVVSPTYKRAKTVTQHLVRKKLPHW